MEKFALTARIKIIKSIWARHGAGNSVMMLNSPLKVRFAPESLCPEVGVLAPKTILSRFSPMNVKDIVSTAFRKIANGSTGPLLATQMSKFASLLCNPIAVLVHILALIETILPQRNTDTTNTGGQRRLILDVEIDSIVVSTPQNGLHTDSTITFEALAINPQHRYCKLLKLEYDMKADAIYKVTQHGNTIKTEALFDPEPRSLRLFLENIRVNPPDTIWSTN